MEQQWPLESSPEADSVNQNPKLRTVDRALSSTRHHFPYEAYLSILTSAKALSIT